MDSTTLFVVWTMVGTASLTLAAIHGVLWLLDRRGLANLAFCIVALSLWRKADREARRRAVVVGGSIVGFLVIGTLQAQLIVWGLVRMPVMVSPAFLIMLGAVTYELCRDIVRSAGIEREAHRLRDEL